MPDFGHQEPTFRASAQSAPSANRLHDHFEQHCRFNTVADAITAITESNPPDDDVRFNGQRAFCVGLSSTAAKVLRAVATEISCETAFVVMRLVLDGCFRTSRLSAPVTVTESEPVDDDEDYRHAAFLLCLTEPACRLIESEFGCVATGIGFAIRQAFVSSYDAPSPEVTPSPGVAHYIATLNREFQFTFVNSAAAAAGGVSLGDVIGLTPTEIWDESTATRYRRVFDAVVETGRTQRFQEVVPNVKTGVLVPATLTIAPLRSRSSVVGVIIVGVPETVSLF